MELSSQRVVLMKRQFPVMARKRDRSPTDKKSVIMERHIWAALKTIADVTNEAHALLKGETKESINDQMKQAAQERIESFIEQFGPLPTEQTSKAEREAYVQRVAKYVEASVNRNFAELNSKH